MTADHWRVFDANCVVGRHQKLQAGGPHTVEDLLADLDHHGVAEALVVDCLSRECHPQDGNARILDVVADHPRLHPVWSALPPGTSDEQPSPGELVQQMRRHRVGALALYPNQYRFTLDDWCLDDLLGPLAEARVPVFINPNEIGPMGISPDQSDLRSLVALCRRWPALPVIVSEYRIRRSQRLLYRALDACGNLHLELSGYWLHHGIEYITRRWGPERLIYGSNWPTFGPGMTLTTLTLADIDDNAKRLIAGDNLRRLLQWCAPEHPDVEPPPPADEYIAVGRSGRRPTGMRFADCHGHLGGRFSHYHIPDGDIDSAVREMDRLGVETCCVFAFSGVVSDERPGNDLVAEAQRRYPERFVGFTMLNPHRGEAEMLRELERGAAMGLRGVKLIPHYQGYPEEGPLIDVACRWAHERKQFILNHHWGSPQQVERLVSTYPDACFITGHTTTAYADVMRRYPNLYVCSCPLLGPRACEEVVAAIGSDRLMFGSDLLDLPIAWGLGPILFARLGAEEKQQILGGNLRRLLARYSLRP